MIALGFAFYYMHKNDKHNACNFTIAMFKTTFPVKTYDPKSLQFMN